jgi:hypothetical protein
MHVLGLALVPIVAAEKSRVPFYIAGGLLVAWALIVSLVLGLRKPAFPWNPRGEHLVIAVTVVLVLAATSTAVLTASPPAQSATTAAAGNGSAGDLSAGK